MEPQPCQASKGDHQGGQAIMGDIRPHRPVLLLLAAFSRYEEALRWARERAEAAWGDVALASQIFAFNQTTFYHKSMGQPLQKTFFAFSRLIDPSELVEIKYQTNQWEADCRRENRWPESRPLNLDPGYLTEAKLVLASTKDRDHRLYLDRGVYAEVTLYFRQGQWRRHPWTYPDYQDPLYHGFFVRCRDYLRARYRQTPAP